jgi:hypothetical protein
MLPNFQHLLNNRQEQQEYPMGGGDASIRLREQRRGEARSEKQSEPEETIRERGDLTVGV